MNEYAIFAFLIVPAIVILLGYLAVRLFERNLDKARESAGE